MHPAPESDSVPKRVWSATALLVLGRLWGALCMLGALALLSRSLSGEQFGRLTFWLSILILLDTLVDFGTSTAALQRGAHDARSLAGTFSSARRIRGAAAALGFLAVVGTARAFDETELGWVALAAILPLSRMLELPAVVYQSRIAWGVPVAVRIGVASARLLFVVLLWRSGVTTFGPYVAAHALGAALGNVVLFLKARRHVASDPTPATGLLRAAVPLALAALFQQAYFHADNLVVRALCGEVELGRYNAAVRILSFLLMISAYATSAALPWLTRRRTAGDLGAATGRLVGPLFLGACLVMGSLWPHAGTLLRRVYGADFEAAASSLRWLLVAGLVIYVGAGLLTAVVASGRTTALLAIAAGGLIVNLAGNLWLVPRMGIDGAAAATVGTELVVTLAALAFLLRSGQRPLPPRWIWIAAPAAFALPAWILG